MRCRFCAVALAVQSATESANGESGGIWRHRVVTCPQCAAQLAHDVVIKVGATTESWLLTNLPVHMPEASEGLHCPACEHVLISALPLDVRPEPATSFSTASATSTRRTDHVCPGCHARYQLAEHVATTWTLATNGGATTTHKAIPSPLPYPRPR